MPAHPADGLYYLSPAMLARKEACSNGRCAWRQAHSNKKGRLPVTLDALTKAEIRYYGAVTWLLVHARAAGTLPYDLCVPRGEDLHWTYMASEQRAKWFMDELCKHAIATGRLVQPTAEGLYYVNYGMLERRGACSQGLIWWFDRYGHSDVPITLNVVREIYETDFNGAEWLHARMWERDYVPSAEYAAHSYTHFGNTPEEFMEALTRRAKREGRIP